ncbi:putative NADH dehydrogenase [Triangularia setosa]|uniref:NADH dehydrogenase n=1 Tax=Triangularia setosa TaxID=2587417 RepID=A0AAN6WCR3_9PEZI|nr:putative NADH dehydrogenase [Podospora setosa]
MADTKTVVILGGSLGGLHVAHALLKKHQQYPNLRVILVSKNTHFYWNIASVRAIIPGQIPDQKMLRELSEALQPYPSNMYELVIGEAISSDFTAKTVKVQLNNSDPESEPREIIYDHLVLATGARYTNDTPWKANSDYQSLVNLLHDTASKVGKASHIIVAGAGATGVEVAGELGYEYGKTKRITLLASGQHVLPGEQESFSSATENELKKLNITIQKGARVREVARALDEKEERYTVQLENGQNLECNLYLPTQGMVPNSDYINAKHLDSKTKTVLVDEFLHVTGVPGNTVWAVGDIVSKPRAGFMITQKQASSVAKNVELTLLQNKEPVPAKGPPVDILACAVGRGRGVGRMGPIRLPSFGVWLAKGRTLGMQFVDQYISGSIA